MSTGGPSVVHQRAATRPAVQVSAQSRGMKEKRGRWSLCEPSGAPKVGPGGRRRHRCRAFGGGQLSSHAEVFFLRSPNFGPYGHFCAKTRFRNRRRLSTVPDLSGRAAQGSIAAPGTVRSSGGRDPSACLISARCTND